MYKLIPGSTEQRVEGTLNQKAAANSKAEGFRTAGRKAHKDGRSVAAVLVTHTFMKHSSIHLPLPHA